MIYEVVVISETAPIAKLLGTSTPRMVTTATVLFLVIPIINAFVLRIGAGGLISVAAWLILGSLIASRTSLTLAIGVGAWTGLVSAVASYVLRFTAHIPAELNCLDNCADFQWIAGARASLIYWPIAGAVISALGGLNPRGSAGQLAVVGGAVVGCGILFVVAATFVDHG